MPEIIPHSGLTLLDALGALGAARDAGMHLIDNGLGDVRISPIIPPGWRAIPIKVKVTAPDRGRVVIAEQVAA